MLALGQSFGRYVVEALVGSGGMGDVHRAHPNAVAIYDLGEEGGAPYIAMELVPP